MKEGNPQKVVNTTSMNVCDQDFLTEWISEFYKAKKVEGVSGYTQAFYKQQLGHFVTYCEKQLIDHVINITPSTIRNYLIWLEEEGHNPGGLHAAYRVLKTFLRWFEQEAEIDKWHNPIVKIKAPKISEEPLDPVEIKDVQELVKTCDSSFLGKRNRAIMLFLLDTGVRARELLSIDLADINLTTGSVLVRLGKGRKSRSVVIGRETRKTVRTYLKERNDTLSALWVTDDKLERLKYGGLRKLLIHHAKLAKIDSPEIHDFRRAFAINMLRNGVDLVTLARFMGHTSIKVLQRYLKQLPEDLQVAHAKGSPVDQAGF